MTLRETIARAMHRRYLARPETIREMAREGPLPDFAGLHDEWRDRYLADADAVLDAMIEAGPTEAMLEEAWSKLAPPAKCHIPGIWRNMLTAAKEERQAHG